jgi:prevent-host-death family protein
MRNKAYRNEFLNRQASHAKVGLEIWSTLENSIMTTVGTYEAKTHLPQLLDRVGRGESVLITRHGKPAAMLVPPPAEKKKNVKELVKAMLQYRDEQERTLGGISFRELIEEGRRY